MERGFLTYCGPCRHVRFFLNYECTECGHHHTRDLSDERRIDDAEKREAVMKTQESLCAQCDELVPLNIVTDEEMFGLLVRKYPACPRCEMHLGDDSLEIRGSTFNEHSIYYRSFDITDKHTVLSLVLLLRHFKDHSPPDDIEEEFLKWKGWAVEKVVDNLVLHGPAEEFFGNLLWDLKEDPGRSPGELVRKNFPNIDLRLELLDFFGYEDESPEEKKRFNERLAEHRSEKKGVDQEPEVLPAVELYGYDLVYGQGEEEGSEGEGGPAESAEDHEPHFREIPVEVKKLTFKPRTTSVGEKEKTSAVWHSMVVVDNEGRTAYLYRPEGFVRENIKQPSFESKRVLDSIIGSRTEEESDVFSGSFIESLPDNDIDFIARKLDKPYLAHYDYKEVVFKPSDRREYFLTDGEDHPSSDVKAMAALVGKYAGESVKSHKRVGICEKCLGITRPYLRKKWQCPECGSRDSASACYCSNCAAEIGEDEHVCGSCGEFLI